MSGLDPQVAAMLDQVAELKNPPLRSLSVPAARELFEQMSQSRGEPAPVEDVTDRSIDGPNGPVPIRVYRPGGSGPHPTIVYYHGGGWVLGGLETEDETCRSLADELGAVVVSVDYRLAPEHPFPAGIEDGYAALEWVADFGDVLGFDTDRLAVAGTSSGGNVAAVVALMARNRDGPALAHQLLLYPALNHPALEDMPSYEENAEGYLLETATMEWFWELYLADSADVRNPYAFPLHARDLSGLAPVTVLTAEFDPLRDEGVAYTERLDAAGVDVDAETYDGMVHGFVGRAAILDGGQAGLEHAVARLREAFEA